MDIVFSAEPRADAGRGNARALRRNGRIPAIVYGDGAPLAISCGAREIMVHAREESFHSSLLVLDIAGKKVKALLRDVQIHPSRREILHLDFQAVREDTALSANVPLHYVGVEDAPGVRLNHGIFTTIENQVSVHCLPKDLPEFIAVDVGEMEIGKSVHLSDITPPEGVSFDAIVRGEDPALAIISEPKVESEEPVEAAAADDAATPEAEEKTD